MKCCGGGFAGLHMRYDGAISRLLSSAAPHHSVTKGNEAQKNSRAVYNLLFTRAMSHKSPFLVMHTTDSRPKSLDFCRIISAEVVVNTNKNSRL
jgi:hypothetical protein